MKPAPFDYCAPRSLDEAIAVLASADNAKIIAGGQSLVPMLNFRLVTPDLLVDITRIAELCGIAPKGRGMSIGALTCHHAAYASPHVKANFPVVSEAMGHVAHLAIRNRGTLGGSLCHADPAGEWPMLARLLDAEMHLAGPGGTRVLEAKDFFIGSLTTAMKANEILTKVDFPALPRNSVYVFDEVSLRAGDYALCAVAVTLSGGGGFLTGGKRVVDARIALAGVGETALRMQAAEGLLTGRKHLNRELIEQAACVVRDGLAPQSDLHASADYRRALAFRLSKRSLERAWQALVVQMEA